MEIARLRCRSVSARCRDGRPGFGFGIDRRPPAGVHVGGSLDAVATRTGRFRVPVVQHGPDTDDAAERRALMSLAGRRPDHTAADTASPWPDWPATPDVARGTVRWPAAACGNRPGAGSSRRGAFRRRADRGARHRHGSHRARSAALLRAGYGPGDADDDVQPGRSVGDIRAWKVYGVRASVPMAAVCRRFHVISTCSPPGPQMGVVACRDGPPGPQHWTVLTEEELWTRRMRRSWLASTT